MMPTKQMALTLLDLARYNRDLARHHGTDPGFAQHHEAEARDQESRAASLDPQVAPVGDKQLLETVQQDPFSQAMAECGAMELRGGQLRTSRRQASRQLLGSPTQAPAQASRWPF
jgi:hypothetical protein